MNLISYSETVAETVADDAAQQSAVGVNTISLLLVAMLIGCGIYCIYSFIRLRKEFYLFPNKFLYPGNCAPESCTDVVGFIDFISPRILLFGIALILFGIAFGVIDIVLHVNSVVIDIASMVVPLALFVWYVLAQRKAAKEFWDLE